MSELVHTDFGRYLASVTERDIDLLLIEEFQVEDEFVCWFCECLGLNGIRPAGAWHSVSDSDGETDVMLRVLSGNRRIGILIENKIGAPEQDQQAERYHVRGARSREAGRFDEYFTVMLAPQRYLDGLGKEVGYQFRVSYEKLADWFAGRSGRRAAWRHQVVLEAIEQGRRGYTMLVSADHTAFHRAYWEHLCRKHPGLQMARPGNKGKKSNWIILKGTRFPKGVKLHHKLDQRTIELGFEGRTVEDVLQELRRLPEDIQLMQKGGTASLVIAVPAIHIAEDLGSQIGVLEEALKAAYRLTSYAPLFERK